MSEYCIYRIDCAASGKAYIGLTKAGVRKRFSAHKYLASTGKQGALYAAMRLYGPAQFAVVVLEEGLTRDEACAREIVLIAEHCTLSPNGYNICIGGGGANGYEPDEETRAKMSETHKQRQSDPALRERTSKALKGRSKSPEHVAKVAAALTGRKHSEETKAKLRAANLGKKQSPETVAKRAEKLKGRVVPEHLRNRLGDWSRGRPKSEEHRRKLSEALKGKPRAARNAGEPVLAD